MVRESSNAAEVLALFEVKEGEPKKQFTLAQIYDLLPEIPESSIKTVVARLRGGEGAPKYIRACSYITQSGSGGKAFPVLELGTESDAPRTTEFVVNAQEEIIRRAKHVRNMAEDRRLQKELADIDNYR